MIQKSTLNLFAKSNKKSMNLSEIRMWLIIKNSKYNFRRQKVIGKYIVDFVSLKYKLIIEIDGNSHDSKSKYDENRILFLNELRYKVLVISQKIDFPNDEIKKFIFEEIEVVVNGESFLRRI